MVTNIYAESRKYFDTWWAKHGWPKPKGDANFTLMNEDRVRKVAFRAYQKGRLDAIRDGRKDER